MCYIGLDVSQRQTAICIVDSSGKLIAEGKVLTLPSDIHGWIKGHVDIDKVINAGLEAGAMSNWLGTELKQLGLPIICLETFQAHRFLETHRNKTDKNDARGLAQLVRLGEAFIKPVKIRSQASQEARALLALRQHAVKQKVDLENTIGGILKIFGLTIQRGHVGKNTFRQRVIEKLCEADARGLKLRETVSPTLTLHEELQRQVAVLSRQVNALTKADPVCRRLMTVPGVGPIVALSFVTAVDDPARFSKGEDVGAYFGLTPRQYQSGETDMQKGTSKRGDVMTRTHLVQAATVLLSRGNKWCALRAWGIKIAKRRGLFKARIAVARKLAIVLHRIWISGEVFRWSERKELGGLEAA